MKFQHYYLSPTEARAVQLIEDKWRNAPREEAAMWADVLSLLQELDNEIGAAQEDCDCE